MRTVDNTIQLDAPFKCANFTLRVDGRVASKVVHRAGEDSRELRSVNTLPSLNAGQFLKDEKATVVCFDLPRGRSELTLA